MSDDGWTRVSNPNKKPAVPEDGWTRVEINDPRKILPSVFKDHDVRVTSTSRSREDPLSIKNPHSAHIDNPNAFDVAPINGLSYGDFIKTLNDHGYDVENAIDEVNHPSGWATGPHWHGVLKLREDGWQRAEKPKAAPTKNDGEESGIWLNGETPKAASNDPLAAATAGTPAYTHEGPVNSPLADSVPGSNLGEVQGGEGNNLERAWNVLTQNPQYHGIDPFGYKQMGDSILRLLSAGNELIRGTPLEGAAVAFPAGLEGLGLELPRLADFAKRVGGKVEITPEGKPYVDTTIENGSVGRYFDDPEHSAPEFQGEDIVVEGRKPAPEKGNGPAEGRDYAPGELEALHDKLGEHFAGEPSDNWTELTMPDGRIQRVFKPENVRREIAKEASNQGPEVFDEVMNHLENGDIVKAADAAGIKGRYGDIGVSIREKGNGLPPEAPAEALDTVSEAPPPIDDWFTLAEMEKSAKERQLARAKKVIDERRREKMRNSVQEEGQEPFSNDNTVDLNEVRRKKEEQAKLQEFATNLSQQVRDRAKSAQQAAEELHDNGVLPFKVGDRFMTSKSRETGALPWEVTGHYVDPKNPDRFGYRVRRGREGVDQESSIMLTSDPAADARMLKHHPEWDRAADVASWKKLEGPSLWKDLLNNEEGSVPRNTVREEEQAPYDPTDPQQQHDLVEKMTQALNNAGRSRRRQTELYHEARKEKLARMRTARETTSGREGLYAELQANKGKMPKVDFAPIEEHFQPEEIHQLFDTVKHSPHLMEYESLNARIGLAKLFKGEVPTKSELDLLGRVFPQSFVKAALKNRMFWDKAGDTFLDAIGLPRTLMSSMDLSAPFRQGIFLVGRPEYWRAFKDMHKFLGSEKFYRAAMDEIRTRNTYPMMVDSGLALSDLGVDIAAREEAFVSTLAERIPGVGRLIRASERSYTGFLNKLRADVFDDLVAKIENTGKGLTQQDLKDVARFINSATGRGNLPGKKLQSAGPLLNSLFFSPRLQVGVIDTLTRPINPKTYTTLNPVVRKEYAKALVSFAGIALTVAALAKYGLGLDVSDNPLSSDFMKIKSGNTRYDILGGRGQYITLAARILTGKKMTAKGKLRDLRKPKYGQDTEYDVVTDFARGKTSPLASLAIDTLDGKDITGQPTDFTNPNPLENTVGKRFIPMFANDIYKAAQDDGWEGVAKTAPGIYGIGVNTYDPNQKKGHKSHKTSGEFIPPPDSITTSDGWTRLQ